MFSTLLDYYTGLKMSNSGNEKIKRFWFWLSITVNLGFLGVFKYYNFFAESFSDAIAKVGFDVDPWTLSVILPVGISFYTFHGLSYVIDIYYDKIKAERNFIDYAVFVSFFPLLVAGPIERATHLLPQIKRKRKFDYLKAVDGLRQILWGLFKKIVIADNCAEYVNQIFGNSMNYSGGVLILGAVLFAFQIYGDFSGYSDIALGTARLFGIELLRNFAFPYFSRDIAEFWRRWHISLSSWFRDYLYIPLGGSRVGLWKKIRNTFIIFIVSGFWHGANLTFIAWGAIHALYFIPLLLTNKNRSNLETVAQGRIFPSLKEWMGMLFTFGITVIAWIFFRADSLGQALRYLKNILLDLIQDSSLVNDTFYQKNQNLNTLLLLLSGFIIVEWIGRDGQYAIAKLGLNWKRPIRYLMYYSIIFLIIWFGGSEQEFIYFQF
jgi:D-alanyl-lipoteichoic acid acyltransferase DltB (MBOAT superfamily)